MKKINLFLFTTLLFLGLGISSCGDDEPKPPTCEESVTVLITTSQAFQADDTNKMKCEAFKSAFDDLIVACDVAALIASGIITQQAYDDIVALVNSIDCNSL